MDKAKTLSLRVVQQQLEVGAYGVTHMSTVQLLLMSGKGD